MILLDQLRPPLPFDPTRGAYKDWLHLNLFDLRSGSIGLVNVSLHGAPDDPRSRAVGTALLHAPDLGWLGNAEVAGIGTATLHDNGVAMRQVGLAVDHRAGRVLASGQFPEDGLLMQVAADALTPALDFPTPLPLGAGWISWYVVPLLTVSGHARLAGGQVSLDGALAYHDHNWGRWHWGDDFGWEWATLVGADGFVCVLARTTDRLHRHPGTLVVIVSGGDYRLIFRGASVQVEHEYRLTRLERRIPGAMAALHQDRGTLRLPHRLVLRADDGADRLTLEFEAAAAAQIVAADPMQRGYSFVNEIAGRFRGQAHLGGRAWDVAGLGILEHVA